MDAEDIIRELNLQPHPEGGFFAETYRSAERLAADALPERFDGERCLATQIYYLLRAGDFSALHRVQADETFHFYAGDEVEMVQIDAGGHLRLHRLGSDVVGGARPQVLVPAGTWQGCRVADGGRFALMGCTVAPGFEFTDFELGRREPLLQTYPQHADVVRRFTHA